MNLENKFGEYWKKLLQYWAVFTAACGGLWNKVKANAAVAWDWLRRNGKVLLQKLAAWLLAAREWLLKSTASFREWLLKTTASARVKGKALAQDLAVWAMSLWEKIRPALARAKDWTAEKLAGLKKPKTVDALPEQEPQALPAGQPAGEAADVKAEAAPVQKPDKPAVQIQNPYLRKTVEILVLIGGGIKLVLKWIWRLRKIFMAAPVIWAAVKFAMENMERLPEQVGMDIQSTGEFARMITRQEAVYWPLGITAFCLVLMFCSKKPMLPWVISIFTLVLPWLIWLMNFYA